MRVVKVLITMMVFFVISDISAKGKDKALITESLDKITVKVNQNEVKEVGVFIYKNGDTSDFDYHRWRSGEMDSYDYKLEKYKNYSKIRVEVVEDGKVIAKKTIKLI